MAQLAVRRREIAEALAEVVTLEFWNGGGSGSVEATAADGAVTEIAAGSGLLVPGIFDHYASFEPRPAAFFGLRVTRKPTPEMATVHGGGLIASGATGADRSPVPWAPPGLHLTGLEGAGEVQTPLTGHPAAQLADRRPGVVPPRQVGRALRARPRRAPRAWGGRHRGGAVLPRLRPCLLRSPPTPAPSPPRWPSACWPLPRRSAPAAWCASTVPPGPARPRWPRPSRTSFPRRTSCTATSCCRGGAGCRASPARSRRSSSRSRAARGAGGRGGTGRRTTGPRATPSSPEGCSCSRASAAGPPRSRALVGVLVWVEAESELRLRRGMARDGEHMRPQWEQWRIDEDVLFARLGTRARADLVVVTG